MMLRLKGLGHVYRQLHATYPFRTGFALCFMKGALADTIVQAMQHQTDAQKSSLGRLADSPMALDSACMTRSESLSNTPRCFSASPVLVLDEPRALDMHR